MLNSSLCDYNDAYILVKGTITVPNTIIAGAAANNTSKKVIIKSCALFIDYISEINNTQVDKAKDINAVMPMYNLIYKVIIIQKHLYIFGSIMEMNQL